MHKVQITRRRSRGRTSKYAAGSGAAVAAAPSAARRGAMTATGAVRGPAVGSFASARLRGRGAAAVFAGFLTETSGSGPGGAFTGAAGAAVRAVVRGATAAGGRAVFSGAGTGFASASRGATALRVRGARGGGAAVSGTS